MQLLNATDMPAAYALGMEPSGREHVIVAVKGTFTIPEEPDATASLASRQVPLVMADLYWGEPGFSAPRYEVDFALRKPRCDILLNATAYAPHGEPTARVRVGAKIGGWSKVFDVTGERHYVQRGATVGPADPEPFVAQPITYDIAFGGIDDTDPDHAEAYMANPIGIGYGTTRAGERITGRTAPRTEDPRQPIDVPYGRYQPMGFGIVGRHWQERAQYAGTYDQHWQDHVFPFLPADFDDRYYQAAPADQQVEELAGGEDVTLVGLTPNGRQSFLLPDIDVPVVFFRDRGEDITDRARPDTVVIEPDFNRLTITWRANLALNRDIFEVPECLIGRKSRGWWRARATGKQYFGSIGDLIRERASGAAA
ncbi:MAG: DUF2169 domain-containing protein [Pseudomonadota bacterium]